MDQAEKMVVLFFILIVVAIAGTVEASIRSNKMPVHLPWLDLLKPLALPIVVAEQHYCETTISFESLI